MGSFTLDGGVARESMTCPGLAYGQAIGSWTARSTRWHVFGHVVGVSTLYNARLLVIDQPARWPAAA